MRPQTAPAPLLLPEPQNALGSRFKSPQHSGKNMGLLTLTPLLVFVVVMASMMFAFHDAAPLVIAEIFLCVCLGAIYIVIARPSTSVYAYIGVLCCVATALGAGLGYYAYKEHVMPYRMFTDLRAYENVLASEPADSKTDAGFIFFANSAAIDTTKAVGFKDMDTYCAAPIMGPASGTRAGFWAVGTNCCLERNDFRCDDAMDPTAHAGLVLWDTTMVGSTHDKYMKAIKMAEAEFGLQTPDAPILLRWTKSPQLIQEGRWNMAMVVFGVSIAGFLCFNAIIACAVVAPKNEA